MRFDVECMTTSKLAQTLASYKTVPEEGEPSDHGPQRTLPSKKKTGEMKALTRTPVK